MTLILPTNSVKDTGYDVANSLRSDNSSSDYLNRTFSSSATATKCTWSFWIKFSKQDLTQQIFQARDSSSSNNLRTFIRYSSGNTLDFLAYNSSGSVVIQLQTNRVFRDPSAYNHIVYQIDTTHGNASFRARMYVNGVQETSFSTESQPSQNTPIRTVSSVHTEIGRNGGSNTNFISGYLCEYVFLDGVDHNATFFGEFDEDTGIWKPKDVSDLTFGTNGFYLDFEDSSALGNDVAGSNNFTVNNLTAIDQSTDTCTNNFATMNPLDNYYQGSTFSEGNLKIVTGSSSQSYNTSTMMVSSGKWYVECKVVSGSATSNIGVVGELSPATSGNNSQIAYKTYGWAYIDSGLVWNNGSSVGGTWSSYTAGDIIGIAINLDNTQGGLNKLYFSKNGVWQNGADPEDYTSVVGVVGITAPTSTTNGAYAFAMNETWNDNTKTFSWNFGSPEFTISSGNADDNSYGNFEYDVPAGFFSLNTKNLAEYG